MLNKNPGTNESPLHAEMVARVESPPPDSFVTGQRVLVDGKYPGELLDTEPNDDGHRIVLLDTGQTVFASIVAPDTGEDGDDQENEKERGELGGKSSEESGS